MNEKDLKALVEQLVGQMVGELDANVVSETVKKATEVVVDNNAYIDDITEVDIRKQLLVKNPKDAEAYLDMKAKTPARLGIGRAGTRYKTETVLRFRADHAAAQDAVFSYVDEEFIKEIFVPDKKRRYCRY